MKGEDIDINMYMSGSRPKTVRDRMRGQLFCHLERSDPVDEPGVGGRGPPPCRLAGEEEGGVHPPAHHLAAHHFPLLTVDVHR